MLPSLSYGLTRIQGVSSNHFSLEPNNSSTAQPNSISRFSLPENALWNTKSTALHFNATTAASGTDAGARLPAKIDSLVQSYRLTAGGVQLSSGHNLYNVLRHAKDVLCGDKTDSVLGHPEFVRSKTYVDGTAAIATTGNEVYANDGNRRFCINHWDGILGSLSPSILDTSLFPSLTLEVVWAPVSVLSSVAGVTLSGTKSATDQLKTTNFTNNGAQGATYTCHDIVLSINVIGMASNLYDEMVSSRMNSVGFLEMPFTNYFMSENTHTGSTRFSVATQSLDRVIVVQRAAGFDTQKAPVLVTGHREANAFVHNHPKADYAAGANLFDVGQAGLENIFDSHTEKYVGAFFNFKETKTSSGTPKYQFQIQGTQIPQVEASVEEMYAISKDAMDVHTPMKNMTLAQYRDNYMVQAIRLALPDSSVFRTISGLDTRGINLDGQYRASNLLASTNVVLFMECTSCIRLGSGRSLEVVV